MSAPLRVLLAGGPPQTTPLVVEALRQGGYEIAFERVDSIDAMRAALERQAWDTILFDQNMPTFDVFSALALVQERGLDQPFFVLSSGVLSDQVGIIMRAGAHDIFGKLDCGRLASALDRELRTAALREDCRRLQIALRESQCQAQRMESVARLAGGVAHDLNDVFTPILLALQYLQQITINPDDQSLLMTLEASALRGVEVVKQVLAFEQDTPRDRVVLQPRHLVHEMARIAAETFPKSINVKTDCAANLHAIKGDAWQLHQALLNLCLNARDSMPQGGTLLLSAVNVSLDETYVRMYPEAKIGNFVLLTVADTGPGISPEMRARIFEPFFTIGATGKGTRLGLASAMGIVKNHDGFLEVFSEDGKGSQFKVHLPVAEEPVAKAADGVATAPPRGQDELILVVEDDEAVRKVIKNTLETNGYRVLTAQEGTQAVSLYAKKHAEIKVVLTDMAMPFLNGPATIRALKKMNPSVSIIAISGVMVAHSEADAKEAGVRAFLPKPFTADRLLTLLREVIQTPPLLPCSSASI